eukprot:TRINITY_DN615_c2_g1_i1.p1 TRINITY_DN615_c2_g1~~TRINITY_DN615_c2_g1_i1.p1  ORF type:complete len:629 (+),score=79.50 TRINITY_DN615_c2_g1_i1:48-1934(+)
MMHVVAKHQGNPHCVEISQHYTVKDLLRGVSEEVGLIPGGFDLYFAGDKLSDPSASIFGKGIEPGSEIEIQISRSASAKARLGNWTESDFYEAAHRIFDVPSHEYESGTNSPPPPRPLSVRTSGPTTTQIDELLDYVDAGLDVETMVSHTLNRVAFHEHSSVFAYYLKEVASRGADKVKLFRNVQPWTYRNVLSHIKLSPEELVDVFHMFFQGTEFGTEAIPTLVKLLDEGLVLKGKEMVSVIKMATESSTCSKELLVDVIRRMAAAGGNINSALAYCAKTKQIVCCEELLKLGATTIQEEGESDGFLIACLHENNEIIDLFLSYDVQAAEGLFRAAAGCISIGNAELFKKIASFKKFKVTESNRYGETLLHLACVHRRLEIAEMVIEMCHKQVATQTEQTNYIRGIDTKGKNSCRRGSPLEVAVRKNCIDIAKLLLKNKALVTASVLSHCTCCEMQDILVNESNGFDLSDTNIPLDTAPFANTPFLIAVKHGCEKVVELLLEKGSADIHQCNRGKCNAMFSVAVIPEAIIKENPGVDIRIAEMLLKKGIKITTGNVRNKEATVLDALSQSYNEFNIKEPILKFFIDRGVSHPSPHIFEGRLDPVYLKRLKKNGNKRRKVKDKLASIF